MIRWILAVSLAACGQGGADRVLKFGPDPAQDAQIAACADLAPATPTRPQPAERSRPAVPHFDALDGGAQAP